MKVPPRIVLASANPAKVEEIRAVLTDLGLDARLVPRPESVPEVREDAPDFLGNARLKAGALCDATGDAALADDSGLEVDALGGAPGVRSARYAGHDATDADNVALVLAELSAAGAVGPVDRRARFRCVVVLRSPDGDELVTSGTVEGHLAEAPIGGRGFGYDPLFVPDNGDGRTFAEMTAQEKHGASHRGRALRALVDRLRSGA